MKRILLAMMILISIGAEAEDWFCTEEAAVRDGNQLQVCGIGESMTEGGARSRALKLAIEEASLLCSVSTDCRGQKVMVVPKRTTCSRDKQGIWKCYRLVLVFIGD